jgi:phosphoribosylformylglycinamidine cyclo-ligase
MHRVFNCGIGLVLVVAEADATRAQALLEASGETVYRIGAVERRQPGTPATSIA